jgi:Na+/H+-dicarboxylate symporter
LYWPGGRVSGLFLFVLLSEAFGLPLEGIGILIALDIVPDMFITGSNVTANLAVAALVDRLGTGH